MSHENELQEPQPKTWYTEVETPKWFREPNETPWAATPLRPYTAQQEDVHEQLEPLFDAPFPAGVPEVFRELVKVDYMAGRAHRETVNLSHFADWLDGYTDGSPIADEMIERAEIASDETVKLLQLMHETSLQATELAKLSIPYGYRMEYLSQMRQAIEDAVRDRGGALLVNQPYGHMHATLRTTQEIVDDEVTANRAVGFLVTYQHDIGRILSSNDELITITERQALAIRVDETSGFPQNLRQQLESGNEQDYAQAEEKVKEFIQANTPEKFMVPLSATVFAHRPKPEEEVHESTKNPILREHRAHLARAALSDDQPE